MEGSVKERLIQFISIKGMTKNRFEKEVGLSSGYIKNLKHQPKSDILEKILQTYPELNSDWLLTGKGVMLDMDGIAELRESNATEFHPTRRAGVPLISQYAYAGYLGGYGDPTYVDMLPTIDFTPDREMTGNWLAFEVKGDSMDDGSKQSYVEGEIVICREVEREYWRDSRLFINKRDFVIVHQDGILIKRIVEHNVALHRITIHSLNPMYHDRVLDLREVKQIFSIVESRLQRRR